LVDFYTFCTSGKRKEYTGVKQNLPLHPNCVSTLPDETKTTYKQHILKSIITVRSIEPVVSNLHRNLSNILLFQFLVENSFTSLLWEKFSHYHKFLTKNRSIFKLNVFNLMKYEANFCDVRRVTWCSYDVIKPLNKWIVEYFFPFLLVQKV